MKKIGASMVCISICRKLSSIWFPFHTISVEVLYFNHCCVWVFRAGFSKKLSFPTIFLK